MEKEATIEEKIRTRKKAKAKERAAATRGMEKGQPAKKKRRVEENEKDQQQESESEVEEKTKKSIPAASPKKRKVNKEEPEKRKAKRLKRADMRGYITCKRWKQDKHKEALEVELHEMTNAETCTQENDDKPGHKDNAEVGTETTSESAEDATPLDQ